MDIGMLWYDDDKKRQLADKVARAVEHYRAKYGSAPTVCFVHPTQFVPNGGMAAGVHLRPERTVMQNHFWLGVENKKSPQGDPTQVEGAGMETPVSRDEAEDSWQNLPAHT